MGYLLAVLGTPLKGRLLERLLRRGPATHKELAEDLGASRQQVATVVAELHLLGVLVEAPLETDRRARLVSVNEQHPFIEPLRVLAIDAANHFARPETWQDLLARHYGDNWYIGGYAAIRRVMQPIDFESGNVLANLTEKPGNLDVPANMNRAAGIHLRTRSIPHVPPEVIPVDRDGGRVWFATPERGFVEAWKLQEIPLYGLFLCVAQDIHDGALDAGEILAVAPSEDMADEMQVILTAVHGRLGRDDSPAVDRAPRPLTPAEQEALDHAINTVVG